MDANLTLISSQQRWTAISALERLSRTGLMRLKWTVSSTPYPLCEIQRAGRAVRTSPKRFGQEALYTHLFGTKLENGHNALFDVLALEEILSHPYLAPWKKVANKHQFLWKK